MAHTLTTTSHDQLDDLLATAVGRFGRPARIIDWDDPEDAPARILTVARMRDRLNGEYRIDDSLVATAIVDRVCDVGLIPRLH
ncbi:MAG: hypothetical protein ABI611_04120 [Solirubrobacteraceae bacterium]